MDYDAAGNLTNDTHTSFGRQDGAPTRVYDAENRLTLVRDGNLQTVSAYTYDADGQRVKRRAGGAEWWQVYGVGGELLAEYPAGAAPFLAEREYGYRGGELLVTMSSGDVDRLRRFVKNLYYNSLARDPSPSELAAKMNDLGQAGAQGGAAQLLTTARAIARSLFESAEYVNRGRAVEEYVTDLYNAYLQRGPDAGGLNHWVGNTNQWGRGATLSAFEASGEFGTLSASVYGMAAGGEDQRIDAFIRNFYYGAFQREPTTAEAQAGRQRLNNAAAVSREQAIAQAQAMGAELIQGANYNAGHTVEQYVTDLYQAFLQRAPDAGGLAHWVNNTNLYGRGATLDAFKGSSEYRELAGTLYRETFWLVADHLGTPRMVANRTGSLAGVRRHDYLPFGEELSAGAGGRTTTQGYDAADNIRQKFTGYERDLETNFDYAGARYYSAGQGRFTSADPLLASGRPVRPQSWNRYAYVLNNPLRFVDPDGLQDQEAQRRTDAQITLAPPPTNIMGTATVTIVEQGFIAESSQPTQTELQLSAALGFTLTLPSVFNAAGSAGAGLTIAPELAMCMGPALAIGGTVFGGAVFWSTLPTMELPPTMPNTSTNASTSVPPQSIVGNSALNPNIYAKQSKKSGRERGTDIPSWARGEKPQAGESGREFAKRIMEKYGRPMDDTGPRSDFNKLKKYGDRNKQ